MQEPKRPLLMNMQRLCLYEFDDLSGEEPETTARVRQLIEEAAGGKMQPHHYSEKFWEEVGSAAAQKEVQNELAMLGKLNSLHLTDVKENDDLTAYSYVLVFENARVLMKFVFDKNLKAHELTTLTAHVTRVLSSEAGTSKSWPVIAGISLLLITGLVLARMKLLSKS